MLSRCTSIDPQTFARAHWERAPLLSRSDALPRDFSDLLSAHDVDELIAERGVRAPFIRLAKDGDLLARDCYLGPAGFGAEVADQVDSAKVLAQFATGATIVLQGLHRLWPPLIDFVRCLVDDLGHPVQANAYITPPASRGFDAHYDVRDVFVLQTAGRKHWTVHEPVVVDPLSAQPWTDYRDAIAQRIAGTPVIDTVLAPGDALYLPRGWVHSAGTHHEQSLHLTVGVSAMTGIDVISAVVDRLAGVDEFRRSLPLGVAPADPSEMTAAATKIIAELSEALRDRAAEFAEGAAASLAQRYAKQTRPISVRPLHSFAAAEAAATTSVRWRHGLIGTIDSGDDRVLLRLPDRTISFPASCRAAVSALHRGLIAAADGLPGLDAADGTVLLRRLLREAVVVPTNPAHSAPADG
jgi:ribosomal protein L16 Arg81 hydroxylase